MQKGRGGAGEGQGRDKVGRHEHKAKAHAQNAVRPEQCCLLMEVLLVHSPTSQNALLGAHTVGC